MLKNCIISLGVTIAESDNLIEWKIIEGVTLIIQIPEKKQYYRCNLQSNH